MLARRDRVRVGFASYPVRGQHWLVRPSSVRVSTLFTALLALGAGATALGLYDIYAAFTKWPVEVRKDLRAGISAKNQGDHALSERYLARAYQTASALPFSALGPEPYLKLSGIAAVLTEVAPQRHAVAVLRDAWDKGGASAAAPASSTGSTDWAGYTLTNEERLRRVAIACKLAELGADANVAHGAGDDAEESWLTWAVEEVLGLAGVQAGRPAQGTSDGGATSVVLAELALPSWIRRSDLGAPLATLGSIYARKGKAEYAMPLYLQAISLLLPPDTKLAQISAEDRCEAAQLMNNLSELIMRRPPSPDIRHQAEAWARQAYGLIQRVQETPTPRGGWFSSRHEPSTEVCEQVLGVVLFNLGMLREMDQDHGTARSLFAESLNQCESVGMKEGVLQAKEALRRVGRAGGNSA